MKKFLLLVIALLGCFTANAALTALHIHTASHGIITLLLEDEPVLTFNDDRSVTIEVKADADQDPIRLDFEDIDSCEYGDEYDYTPNAVDEIAPEETQAVTVRIDGSGVEFGNLPDGADIEVYNLGGVRVLNASTHDNTYYLDRSALSHGVYIVRIGAFVTKLSL